MSIMQQLDLLVNAAQRRLDNLFPGFFNTNTKHTNLYEEFGYPQAPDFNTFYAKFKRNGFAAGAINKTVRKTWQDDPWLLEERSASEKSDDHAERPIERDLRKELERLEFWHKLKQADKRSLVGRYAALLIRFRDGQQLDQPVTMANGLASVAELVPLWEPQLIVSEWDDDPVSENYGKPKMYQLNESALPGHQAGAGRQLNVHPDRVFIWSADGTVHGEYALEPGLNHLLDIEKVMGAGGEGFWKNAKNAPTISMDPAVDPQELADMLGVTPDKIQEAMNEHVQDWQRGFDKLLMGQGMQFGTLGVTLPQPKEFIEGPLMGFSASYGIPLKILAGSQTGERASTEDASEWDETNMARRSEIVKPNIMRFVNKLLGLRAWPISSKGWAIDWSDLTEASMEDKIERADKMAAVNQKNMGRGEVYRVDEIRAVTGHEAIEAEDAEPYEDDEDEGEDDA